MDKKLSQKNNLIAPMQCFPGRRFILTLAALLRWLLLLLAVGLSSAALAHKPSDHEGKKIVATEFFELQGPRALKYEFFVYDGTGGPIAYRISFGKLKEGERTYHLDRQYPDNSHETLGSFNSEFSYDEVKAMATAVVSGKRKAASASPAR